MHVAVGGSFEWSRGLALTTMSSPLYTRSGRFIRLRLRRSTARDMLVCRTLLNHQL